MSSHITAHSVWFYDAKIYNFFTFFLLQVRRGSEPSLHKPASDNNIVTTTSGSVQAVIASINARTSLSASSSTSATAVSRSLSSNEIIMQQHLR